MKKAQSSLEFVLTFAIGFGLILILSGLYLTYSTGATDTLNRQQIEKIGRDIISNVEKIYFLGEGNRVTYTTTFPEDITNMSIHHANNSNATHTIVFDYLNITYIQDSTYASSIFTAKENYIRFNCTNCSHFPARNISIYDDDDFSGGTKKIKVESEGEWVSIDFVK